MAGLTLGIALSASKVLEGLAGVTVGGLRVADRYRLLTCSAFDVDWGSDHDLVMLPSFLDHFDRDGCVALHAKAILAQFSFDILPAAWQGAGRLCRPPAEPRIEPSYCRVKGR